VVEDFAADAGRTIPSMLISRRTLERQLDWIGRRYRFVTLDELGAGLDGEKKFSRPAAAVTFDDGYSDVYHNAFPLLKKKGIPSAVFVVTDLVGTSRLQLHDRLFLLLTRAFAGGHLEPENFSTFLDKLEIRLPAETKIGGIDALDCSPAVNALLAALPQAEIHRLLEALEALETIEENIIEMHRSLTWEMIREMHRSDTTIGSHTRTHAVLTVEGLAKVADEVRGSKKTREQKLGTEARHFAYPDGRFNDATVQVVAAAGYRFAYATSRRRSAAPALTIPRLLLWENSCFDARGNFSPAILNCQIQGVFDLAHS
jgi:peptidoglycan/xylan/chitin deacetylase (PgdA/CDA1 family)